MIVTRERTVKELTSVLGGAVVQESGLAIPELLKMAVVEMFLADDAYKHADCAYICAFLLRRLRMTGALEFESIV
jgi:hypothetical protein